MKKTAWLFLFCVLFFENSSLFAEEATEKASVLKRTVDIEKRGVVNFLTSPGEIVNAFKTEKKEHPKAWPATYIPRFFSNLTMRVASSANDMIALPWYAGVINDSTPLTRHFDLPDYVWEKEK